VSFCAQAQVKRDYSQCTSDGVYDVKRPLSYLVEV
jgi:hypothetical protein